MIDVVALGELLIDFTMVSADECGYPTMAAHPGGAPANFLAALTKYGKKTALLGKVGTDKFGRLLIDTLRTAGIDTRGLISAEDVFTTLAFVTLDETGDREFSFARKPGADTCLTTEELDLSRIDDAAVFHFGTLSLTAEPARSATHAAVAHAKAQGKLISFDPNLRLPLWDDPQAAKTTMLWGLSQADIVKISDEEVAFLWDLSPLEGARHICQTYGTSLVWVTCGAEGCCYKNPNCEGFIPALINIKVIDTTGAGDIFGGAAMHKLLESGKDPKTLTSEELDAIGRFACAAAGLSTTRPGGLSGIPALEEITSYL